MYLVMYQRPSGSSDSSSSNTLDVYEGQKSEARKAIEDAKTWKDSSKANEAIAVHQKNIRKADQYSGSYIRLRGHCRKEKGKNPSH